MLGARERPLVVIVTACASHAVGAFAIRAADYLLEPVTDQRLVACIERLRDELRLRRQSHLDEDIRDLLDGVGDQPPNLDGGAYDQPGRRNYASRITAGCPAARCRSSGGIPPTDRSDRMKCATA